MGYGILAAAAAILIVILLDLFLLAPRRKSPPLLRVLRTYRFAHRGYHDSADGIPENSLAAFRRAVEHGFGAELDVHLSRDGRLVVMHDESLKRTCGVDRSISELTADELSAYRLEGTDEKIPFLEEVLPIFEGRTPLVVEVKPVHKNHAALCEATCAMLDSFSADYCMESFDPRAVLWLRKNRPDIVRGQLAENFTRHGEKLAAPLRFALHNLLTNALTRPDFVACRVDDRRDLSFRTATKLLGAQEFSWTVRTPEEQRAVEKDGGVIIFELFDPTL